MKRIPIGIEDFRELRENNYYYIDKTAFIQDVLSEKVALYTRPRRFGKTLNMSMLYYFFSVKEKEHAGIFENLVIAKDACARQHQNQYPVIFMTMKDMKSSTMEKQFQIYGDLIQNICMKFEELLDSEKLNYAEKATVRKYYEGTANEIELQNALKNFTQYLEKHYQKKVIVLIDEYDVPLQAAYKKGYYDQMAEFMGGVFSAVLKTNGHLEKGIMTGCLRISKESIFTGLNNFKVNAITDVQSGNAYGFTQKEMDELLKDYHLESCTQEVKEWYDGYLFGKTEIYNPWSTLMYVDRKCCDASQGPVSFWANTSSNDIVYNYIQNADGRLYDEFESLMQGKAIRKKIKPELTYRDMDDIDHVYSSLLFTGYLKISKQTGVDTYELVIPNKEIYEIFNQSFMEYFEGLRRGKKTDFVEALKEERLAEAEQILTGILRKSISYYGNYESFYHGFLMGFLEDYQVESNREAGDGRLDLVIYPQIFRDTAVVIECKHSEAEEELVADSREGARQIADMHYLEGILSKGYARAVGYGISFYKKRCAISETK